MVASETADRAEAFGPYRLIREIASGGMATVYEAVRVADGRRVAIKRIHPHLAKDADFVAMFVDEAKIASRIEHPNVCRVLDAGHVEGASYLAMEMLEGRTLQQVLSALARTDGAGHLGFVLGVLIECAEGLHAAHELRGDDGRLLDVVHRDVSPHNLFVTFTGEVKVVDFGVASARDKNHRTETGEIKGKLAYMAPEQTAGKVDRRADIWALGVVLWEAITLKRLFRRSTQPETLAAVERDPIPPPSSTRAGIPASLDRLVLQVLARDRDARPPDAAVLAARLREILSEMGSAPTREDRAATMAELFGVTRHVAPLVRASGPDEVTQLAQAPASDRAPEARSPRWLLGLVSVAALIGLGTWAWLQPPAAPSPRIATPAPAAPMVEPPSTTLVAPPASPPALAPAELEPSSVVAVPEARSGRVDRAPRSDRPAVPPVSTAPELVSPVPDVPAGEGRVTVPMGVAVCLDGPCDRADAVFGPRTLRLPSGEHRVTYIEVEGPDRGPSTAIGSATFSVAPDTTTVIRGP